MSEKDDIVPSTARNVPIAKREALRRLCEGPDSKRGITPSRQLVQVFEDDRDPTKHYVTTPSGDETIIAYNIVGGPQDIYFREEELPDRLFQSSPRDANAYLLGLRPKNIDTRDDGYSPILKQEVVFLRINDEGLVKRALEYVPFDD